VVHNNIIFGNNIGIYGHSTCSASIYNNIITQNAAAGISDRNSSGASVTFTIRNNLITENGTYGMHHPGYGTYLASFNNLWGNTSGNYSGTISQNGEISADPLFIDSSTGNYRLSSSSPSIDAGQPIAADNDPDGTRNDQGVYGGPGAANFWPSPAGGPVVTDLSVTPPSVPVGGTITLQATGKIQ